MHLFSQLFMILTILTNPLNDNLKIISDWVYQRKMSLNPNLTKQAQEVMFYRKLSLYHPVVTFNISPVEQTPC